MKLVTTYLNAETAMECDVLRARQREVLDVLSDLMVPSYPGKSPGREHLDLVHPILNAVVEYWLKVMGWDSQCVLSRMTNGLEDNKSSIDFAFELPSGKFIAVEVQFGNTGRLEKDFTKFRQLHRNGLLALGMLVYFDTATANTADSSLATYEKALSLRKELDAMPVCIAGVNRQDTEVVDLRALPGIVFPSVLGGSGKDKKPLFRFVAEGLIERRDPAQMVLPPAAQRVVHAHAKDHMKKACHAFMVHIGRAAQCEDTNLREQLLAPALAMLKSSYAPTMAAAAAPAARKPRAPRVMHPTAIEQSAAPIVVAHASPSLPRPEAPRVRVRKADIDYKAARPWAPPVVARPRGPIHHFAMASALHAAMDAHTPSA